MITFESLKHGPDGLVPAVVQDSETLQVVMVGYMNAEALAATYTKRQVTFYSRSRDKLWTKGETSGNTLALVSIEADCDMDTLLVKARPAGPTCHEGTPSCFGREGASGVGFLAALDQLIDRRRGGDPQGSYTARLLHGSLVKAAQKVGEEGVETALAAVAESDEAFLNEASDLLYHVLVLARHKGLSLTQILTVLESRHQ
ncbi:bifunctional phosphoribosyl-AMP cyclohydrolase/phosphoribosyl-ATP diphosphatase HisIE [Algimonas porphyrae]|uniref:Histidine biosynthesis bifunctional protein HisIE n=1 Tax=Algimonas porphyrae TaxID=1128113 RepID=A0ABQ5UVF9_9PROT|nr:bifunctional phosphoribosyl-AMP cyclohydrolase/phosphoribosyl-ATP diphosphatase HisIE [Algimonas porphyrae]GLQ19092.1 histidine biosynthesis bifunctional protein HisIE [Algimonas porphyrae]